MRDGMASPATKRILILMSDTGGGHRSAAEAIAEGLEHIRPGEFDVQLLDFITDCTPPPLNRIGRLYRPAVTYGGPLWGWFGACTTATGEWRSS